MTGSASSSTDAVEQIFDENNPDPQRWRALMVIAIAQLMVVLDASIVNLALPSAKRALDISDANQQWVITAYTLTFGGLLLLGGRIADYVGRKRTFMIGLIGFAAVSALGAAAPDQAWLFACRALQGAFAALLAPSALSLMTVTFHAPKERARAFGVFGAISGGGAAIGLLLGGFLTEYLSWRWCLLVNTPIAIVALLLAIRYVRESKTAGSTKYDIPGAVTATLGLVTLVYAFTKAAPAGRGDGSHWGSATTVSLFVIAVILLFSFVLIELRTANPLLPMRILLDRNRGGAYLVSLILGVAIFAMFLFLGLYLQVILGYSPVTAGFAFLPFTVGIIFGSAIFSQLLPRVGPRPIMVPGLLGGSLALVWLAQLTPTSSYWTHILPPMLLLSVSMAAVFIPMTSAALHAIKSDDAGVASAVLNTTQQVGASLGTALLNTVAATVTATYLAAHLGDGPGAIPGAVVDGYSKAFLVGAGLMVVGALVAAFLMNIGKEAASENDLPIAVG